MKPSLRRIVVSVAVLAAAVPFSIRASQDTGLSQAARNAGDAYIRALAAAGEFYSLRSYSKALDKLEIADQIAPNIPDTWQLRGAIYADEHAFEKAEDAFEKQAKLMPGDFWPQYNIAELLLMEKKYGPAAEAFHKLTVFAGHEELVAFKLVYADLLAEKPDDAKPVLDAMKFPADTPAYYYAHAAWGFAHKDQKDGNYWSGAGLNVFGQARCASFYDALALAGWVPPRGADGLVPQQSKGLAPEPQATPGLDLMPHASGTP